MAMLKIKKKNQKKRWNGEDSLIVEPSSAIM